MESLTGPQAVKKAMNMTLDNDPAPPTPTIVHFKVSLGNGGICVHRTVIVTRVGQRIPKL